MINRKMGTTRHVPIIRSTKWHAEGTFDVEGAKDDFVIAFVI